MLEIILNAGIRIDVGAMSSEHNYYNVLYSVAHIFKCTVPTKIAGRRKTYVTYRIVA